MLPVADTSYPVNRITPAVLSGPRLHTIHCRDIYGLRVLRPEDTPLRWNDSYTPHKPDSHRHKSTGNQSVVQLKHRSHSIIRLLHVHTALAFYGFNQPIFLLAEIRQFRYDFLTRPLLFQLANQRLPLSQTLFALFLYLLVIQ